MPGQNNYIPLENIRRKISEEDWLNYKIEVIERKGEARRLNWEPRVPFNQWDYDYTEPDTICSHFGCGRKLSLRELMFGDRCINHQSQEEKPITLIDQVLKFP